MSLPDPASLTKVCKNCYVPKPVNEFYQGRAVCKECLKVTRRDQRRESNARYYAHRRDLANQQERAEGGHDTDEHSSDSEQKSPVPVRREGRVDDLHDSEEELEEDEDEDQMEPPNPVLLFRNQLQEFIANARNSEDRINALLQRMVDQQTVQITELQNQTQLMERFMRLHLMKSLNQNKPE
jgi:hypothetical protein